MSPQCQVYFISAIVVIGYFKINKMLKNMQTIITFIEEE
jgi:hypothetical protein